MLYLPHNLISNHDIGTTSFARDRSVMIPILSETDNLKHYQFI